MRFAGVLTLLTILGVSGGVAILFGTPIARDGRKAKGGMAGSAGGKWWASRGGLRPIQRSMQGHDRERVRRPAWF